MNLHGKSQLAVFVIRVPDSGCSKGDHGDLDLVGLFEVILHLLDGHRTLDVDLLPLGEFSWDDADGAAHDRVELFVLIDDGLNGVVKHPKRKSQVDSHILVGVCWLLQNVFDDLNADGSYNHGCCGGNGGDDLACDQLYLEVVDLVDLVVSSSQVGDSAHELNMPVGWVVFLELDWGWGILCVGCDLV